MQCPKCPNPTDIVEDPTRGSLVCMECGTVVRDGNIVFEVEFVESSHGASAAVGGFVASDSHVVGVRESRKFTEANAKRWIERICCQLRLGESVVTSAFGYYRSALYRGLTRGRPLQHMVCACIYLAARQKDCKLMLLDLSDIVRINVYTLGHTYLEMKEKLHLNLPEIDPGLYIDRFASQMELGSKTGAVAQTAKRLLQRMKKDWMYTGRRPNGVAAAALLVAARIHNFNRTDGDVARIARISEHTTKKRLEELGRTATSALCIDDFMTIDLDEEHNPPAFNEQRGKKDVAMLMSDEELGKITAEMNELEKLIDMEMAKSAEKKIAKAPWSRMLRPDGTVAPGVMQLFNPDAPAPASTDPTAESEDLTSRALLRDALESVVEPDLLADCVEELHRVTTCDGSTLSRMLQQGEGTADTTAVPGPSTSSSVEPPLTKLPIYLPNAVEREKEQSQEAEKAETGDLDLTGIDDDELQREYMLERHEIAVKAYEWYSENARFVDQRRKKQLEQQRRLEEDEKNPKKKKRRAAARPGGLGAMKGGYPQAGADNSEEVRRVVQEMKRSKKINYDALAASTSASTPAAHTEQPASKKSKTEPVVTVPSLASSLRVLTSVPMTTSGPSQQLEVESLPKPLMQHHVEEVEDDYEEEEDDQEGGAAALDTSTGLYGAPVYGDNWDDEDGEYGHEFF